MPRSLSAISSRASFESKMREVRSHHSYDLSVRAVYRQVNLGALDPKLTWIIRGQLVRAAQPSIWGPHDPDTSNPRV